MESLQFYQRLREHDQPRVESLVRKLQREDFDVYATGSSLFNPFYADIDLSVRPRGLYRTMSSSKYGEVMKNFDMAVHYFLEDMSGAEFSDKPISVLVQPRCDVLRYTPEGYAAEVRERRVVQFKDTTFEITFILDSEMLVSVDYVKL